jgi:hypothetical protein
LLNVCFIHCHLNLLSNCLQTIFSMCLNVSNAI